MLVGADLGALPDCFRLRVDLRRGDPGVLVSGVIRFFFDDLDPFAGVGAGVLLAGVTSLPLDALEFFAGVCLLFGLVA